MSQCILQYNFLVLVKIRLKVLIQVEVISNCNVHCYLKYYFGLSQMVTSALAILLNTLPKQAVE